MGNTALVPNEIESDNTIKFTINERDFTVDLTKLPADITLNTFIRTHTPWTGTKVMCLEGGCGCCVCMVRGRSPVNNEERVWTTTSCLTLLGTCNNLDITTIEGIGNSLTGYHPIQKRLAQKFGSQCGFCSPGMVMNMYGLMQSKNDSVTMKEVEHHFSGNLCRCTGYRPILDAMKSFAKDTNIVVPKECDDIEDLVIVQCPKTGRQCSGSCDRTENRPAIISADQAEWYMPDKLSELYQILATIKGKPYILVAGNTAHGVYRRPLNIKIFIDINNISHLQTVSMQRNTLSIGANVKLTDCMDIFNKYSKTSGFEYLTKLREHFSNIANVHVLNSGTLAGNLMIKYAHPEFPSDIFVTFLALNVEVVLSSAPGDSQTLSLEEFTKTNMTGKIILTFILPSYPKDTFLFDSYKIMSRAQNAYAYVNAGFLLQFKANTKVVKSARICFGGISPDFISATEVEAYLVGKSPFTGKICTDILKVLFKELRPDTKLPQTPAPYRKLLACGLFYKFLLRNSSDVNPKYVSGGQVLQRPLSSGSQSYDTYEKFYPVTQPVPLLGILSQCAGEAKYMNDLPPQPDEVFAAFVVATRPGACIEHIDASAALKIPGVLAFYSASDIPGINTINSIYAFFIEFEELFCSGEVKYHGQPIGVIVALSSSLANSATKYVKVLYSSVNRKILPTLDDVIESGAISRIKSGGAVQARKTVLEGTITVSGNLQVGPQYHFTLEPQTTIVLPEADRLKVYCATQFSIVTQTAIAQLLKMNSSDIQLDVRRLGGAYGYKISRCNFAACAAALAAVKLQRPVRFVQTIESMMHSLGKRSPCYDEYSFQVDENGKILSGQRNFYCDPGCSENESTLIVAPPVISCYVLNNVSTNGHSIITDAPSNTYCRAPGSLETMAMIENTMEHIAFVTRRDPVDVRLQNIASDNPMTQMLKDFIVSVEYKARRKDVDNYNNLNRWRKRGLGIAVMDYSIVYYGLFTALVSIYHADGSVVIKTGGVEMGQGLNTKVAQVAAYTLGIPLELITIESHDTIIGANNMVTGGSVGTECSCKAVQKCCNVLNQRLEPIRKETPTASWLEIVQKAHGNTISLSALEEFNKEDMKPYNLQGICLTEVEVDMLTGNHLIKRVDILEDVGRSLNPKLDVGQIEGGFVMGLGYWLTEKLTYDRMTGKLLTDRTWEYKVPGALDIPIDFRVNFVKNSTNTNGFLGSKATGEPATCFAVTAMFAIRDAVFSARKDAGLERQWIAFGAPTTPDVILLNSGSNQENYSLN